MIDGKRGKIRSVVNVEQAARIRQTDGDKSLKTEKWKRFESRMRRKMALRPLRVRPLENSAPKSLRC